MTVYLVGAGPGDPGLLTVRGAQVLGRADVVVYDRLSVGSLLDLAPEGAELISVGKTPQGPSTPQEEINRLLIDKGRTGVTVVRLKGGDPFVFARGGEEAAALAVADVAFEVVPGITSAIAAPAYAGIPVTHRGLSTSFTVVTGHEDPWAATETDWEAVARVGGTIVVLMGVATRAAIAHRLIEGGLSADTPVASVQWGTRAEQVVVRTTLAGLASADISSPATIVIGAVAGLDLGWVEGRPLWGKRVIVTRAAHQALDLVTTLRDLGGDAVEIPAVQMIGPSDEGAALEAAVSHLPMFDWVVLSSANGVDELMRRVPDVRSLASVRVAAVGPSTAASLLAAGIVADLVPDQHSAADLVGAFPEGSGRVLLPQSAQSRPTLADGLRHKGWYVEEVEAYRTEAAPLDEADRSRAEGADAIAFASPSAVEAWLNRDMPVPPVVACIGPTTAQAARDHHLAGVIEAKTPTAQGLVDLLVAELQP